MLCRDCIEAEGKTALGTGEVDICQKCGEIRMLCRAVDPEADAVDALLAGGWNVTVLDKGKTIDLVLDILWLCFAPGDEREDFFDSLVTREGDLHAAIGWLESLRDKHSHTPSGASYDAEMGQGCAGYNDAFGLGDELAADDDYPDWDN